MDFWLIFWFGIYLKYFWHNIGSIITCLVLLLLRGYDNMKYMFKIPFCWILVRYIFEDRERYVCFFVETSTAHHHNVALTHTHTHTHTHTWRSNSGCEVKWIQIFRVCAILISTQWGHEFFRPPGGHAIYEKIILRELIISFHLCLYFLTQALCCKCIR